MAWILTPELFPLFYSQYSVGVVDLQVPVTPGWVTPVYTRAVLHDNMNNAPHHCHEYGKPPPNHAELLICYASKTGPNIKLVNCTIHNLEQTDHILFAMALL